MVDVRRRGSYTNAAMRCYLGVIGLSFLLLGACRPPAQPTGPTSWQFDQEETIARDQLFRAAAQTLRRQQFRLDRVDRRAGVITTYAKTSQHFFEWWRHDVASAYDWIDATVNPVRRRVELAISHAEDRPHQPTIRVTVYKERLSAPDRQFNDAGAAYQFFGFSLPATTGQPVITPDDERWVARGRDGLMEQYLLDEIISQARSTQPTEEPTDVRP